MSSPSGVRLERAPAAGLLIQLQMCSRMLGQTRDAPDGESNHFQTVDVSVHLSESITGTRVGRSGQAADLPTREARSADAAAGETVGRPEVMDRPGFMRKTGHRPAASGSTVRALTW
jgi:hypothetical protein